MLFKRPNDVESAHTGTPNRVAVTRSDEQQQSYQAKVNLRPRGDGGQ